MDKLKKLEAMREHIAEGKKSSAKAYDSLMADFRERWDEKGEDEAMYMLKWKSDDMFMYYERMYFWEMFDGAVNVESVEKLDGTEESLSEEDVWDHFMKVYERQLEAALSNDNMKTSVDGHGLRDVGRDIARKKVLKSLRDKLRFM